jgi:hypothetical protein
MGGSENSLLRHRPTGRKAGGEIKTAQQAIIGYAEGSASNGRPLGQKRAHKIDEAIPNRPRP